MIRVLPTRGLPVEIEIEVVLTNKWRLKSGVRIIERIVSCVLRHLIGLGEDCKSIVSSSFLMVDVRRRRNMKKYTLKYDKDL